MKVEDRIRYNLVYSEQIQRYLVNMGLTPKQADFFIFNAAKRRPVEGLRLDFQGNDRQWDLLKEAAPSAVHSSHATAIFMSEW